MPSQSKKPRVDDTLLNHARRMRREQTDAERQMWSLRRGRRLGGFKFRRQHPIGGYIIDFYCDAAGLGVELDGGQHGEEEQMKHDAKRAAYLATRGIRIIRFWDDDVLKHTDVVAEAIYTALTERTDNPPSP
jgi:very-short-patch-repair endonuclease